MMNASKIIAPASIAKKYQLKLYLSLDIQKKSSFEHDARDYALNFFYITQNNLIDAKQLDLIEYQNIYEIDIIQKNLPTDKVLYLNDYCESEIFFKDNKEEIRKLFMFQENKISDVISTTSKSI